MNIKLISFAKLKSNENSRQIKDSELKAEKI